NRADCNARSIDCRGDALRVTEAIAGALCGRQKQRAESAIGYCAECRRNCASKECRVGVQTRERYVDARRSAKPARWNPGLASFFLDVDDLFLGLLNLASHAL